MKRKWRDSEDDSDYEVEKKRTKVCAFVLRSCSLLLICDVFYRERSAAAPNLASLLAGCGLQFGLVIGCSPSYFESGMYSVHSLHV
jgi:hypothetical protein